MNTALLKRYLAERYRTQKAECLTYAAIMAGNILFGLWSAWYHRGSANFMWDLTLLSLAYCLPAIFIIHVIWKADDRFISRTLSFLFGLMFTVIFCVVIQWFFFAAGRTVFGAKDFRNAIVLCEQSKDWAVANQDKLNFDETFVNTTLPDGRTLSLGNIERPRIVHWNKRAFKDDGTSETTSLLFCRFTDPRRNENAFEYTQVYDFQTGKWSHGEPDQFNTP